MIIKTYSNMIIKSCRTTYSYIAFDIHVHVDVVIVFSDNVAITCLIATEIHKANELCSG